MSNCKYVHCRIYERTSSLRLAFVQIIDHCIATSLERPRSTPKSSSTIRGLPDSAHIAFLVGSSHTDTKRLVSYHSSTRLLRFVCVHHLGVFVSAECWQGVHPALSLHAGVLNHSIDGLHHVDSFCRKGNHTAGRSSGLPVGTS